MTAHHNTTELSLAADCCRPEVLRLSELPVLDSILSEGRKVLSGKPVASTRTLVIDKDLSSLGLDALFYLDGFTLDGRCPGPALRSLLFCLCEHGGHVLRVTGTEGREHIRLEGTWRPTSRGENLVFDSARYSVFCNSSASEYLLVQSGLLS